MFWLPWTATADSNLGGGINPPRAIPAPAQNGVATTAVDHLLAQPGLAATSTIGRVSLQIGDVGAPTFTSSIAVRDRQRDALGALNDECGVRRRVRDSRLSEVLAPTPLPQVWTPSVRLPVR